MKRVLLGFALALAGGAYLAYSEYGEGSADDHQYTWHRFDVGPYVVELHLGTRR